MVQEIILPPDCVETSPARVGIARTGATAGVKGASFDRAGCAQTCIRLLMPSGEATG
jgi:hypothetical protein